MSKPYSDVERPISTACAVARTSKKVNFAALAREYDVPVGRLRARFADRPSRMTCETTYSRLNKTQIASLINWITRLDELHVPPTARMVASAANALLQRSNPDVHPLHKDWAYSFATKHLPSDLYWVQQKPADQNRITAEDIGVLTAWYERLEPLLKRIPPKHVYNFDETGFALGQGKPQKVFSRNIHRTRTHSFERGQLITVIECIAADGWIMEPYFVAPGKTHLVRWYDGGKLSEGSRIAVSESGYSNDLLAIDWLHFFQENTRRRLGKNGNEPRLLIFDGHASHLTYEFLDICALYNIIPYVCPPRTTHLIQPLDGSPFRALKQAYRTKNNEITQWGGDARDIAVFFTEITAIRANAMKPRTIRKTFADRGILPYNPALVIDSLVAEQTPEPELQIFDDNTPPPEQVSSIPTTPAKSVYDAQRTYNKMVNLFDQSPNIEVKIRTQMLRVAEAQIRLTEQIGLLNNTLETVLPKQRQIARKSRKQIDKFGVLSTTDANRHIKDKNQAEAIKAELEAIRNRPILGDSATPVKYYLPYGKTSHPDLEEDYS